MRKFGWIKQKEDPRDLVFKAKVANYPVENLKLKAQIEAPLDQGELGSCTAHGIRGALTVAMLNSKVVPFPISRLFIYFEERFLEGTVNEDSGAEIRDGIKVVNRIGVPHETLWKYDITRFKDHPSVSAYDDAKLHKSLKYEAVRAVGNDFRAAICEGTPVILGFTVYSSFDKIKHSGYMPDPQKWEQQMGGHCVYAWGYDKHGVWCRNSWGDKWGKGGDFRMSWKFLESGNVADCWRIQIVT